MIDYVFTNLVLSACCIMTLWLLPKVPSRVRLYIALFCMVMWFVPWHLLQFSVPLVSLPLLSDSIQAFSIPTYDFVFEPEAIAHSQAQAISLTSFSSWYTQWSAYENTSYLWITMLVIGLSVGLWLLATDIASYRRLANKLTLSALERSSVNPQKHIKAIGFNTAISVVTVDEPFHGMATGFVKPTVWLGKSIHTPSQRNTILAHELTHVQNKDPQLLWFITLMQRLMWFNPIVWWLAQFARKHIELACDEACQQQFEPGLYQQKLIELVINAPRVHSVSNVVVSMSATRAFSVERIKSLNEERKMKMHHKAILSLLMCSIGWVSISNATSNITPSLQSKNPQSNKQLHTNLEDHFPRFNEFLKKEGYIGAQQYMQQVASNIDLYTPQEQADIWYNLALSYIADENVYDIEDVKEYLDNGLALNAEARPATIDRLFQLAYSLSLRADEHSISLNYLTQWQASGKQLNAQQSFHLGVLYYQLEQYDKALVILTELLTQEEHKGQSPDTNVLKLLVGINYSKGNLQDALTFQEKLTNLEQSEKNQQLLLELRYAVENNAQSTLPVKPIS